MEVPAYNGRLHSKFEVNCASHFRDVSDHKVSVFFSLAFRTNHKIDSNLQACILIWLKFGTFVGYIQANSGAILVRIQQKFTELQTFICVCKDQTFFDTPTG